MGLGNDHHRSSLGYPGPSSEGATLYLGQAFVAEALFVGVANTIAGLAADQIHLAQLTPGGVTAGILLDSESPGGGVLTCGCCTIPNALTEKGNPTLNSERPITHLDKVVVLSHNN